MNTGRFPPRALSSSSCRSKKSAPTPICLPMFNGATGARGERDTALRKDEADESPIKLRHPGQNRLQKAKRLAKGAKRQQAIIPTRRWSEQVILREKRFQQLERAVSRLVGKRRLDWFSTKGRQKERSSLGGKKPKGQRGITQLRKKNSQGY